MTVRRHRRGVHTQRDRPHPQGAYAVQAGGRIVLRGLTRSTADHPDLGCVWPGGLNTARGNFIELMLRLAGSHPAIRGGDHFASPNLCSLLARGPRTSWIARNGLFSRGGRNRDSWFDYARIIFRAAGFSRAADRPMSASIETSARRDEVFGDCRTPRWRAASEADGRRWRIAAHVSGSREKFFAK